VISQYRSAAEGHDDRSAGHDALLQYVVHVIPPVEPMEYLERLTAACLKIPRDLQTPR